MHNEDYNDLYELEDHFWWFAGMRSISGVLLDQYCGGNCTRRILDAGCGTGANLVWLQRYANQGEIYGIDVSGEALNLARRRQSQGLVQASVTNLPFDDASFDLVTSFDVVVQLSNAGDGTRAMREMYRVLKRGGIGMVRAAAYEWLRSGHDEALGTRRRYRLSELTSQLELSGLTVLRATYANSLLLPIAVFQRLVLKRLRLGNRGSDVTPLPPWLAPLNTTMRGLLQVEAKWLDTMPFKLPVGVSAICVVRKQEP